MVDLNVKKIERNLGGLVAGGLTAFAAPQIMQSVEARLGVQRQGLIGTLAGLALFSMGGAASLPGFALFVTEGRRALESSGTAVGLRDSTTGRVAAMVQGAGSGPLPAQTATSAPADEFAGSADDEFAGGYDEDDDE